MPGSPPAAVRAVKAANTVTPIIFSVGGDAVKFGLVASLARPEGNATGVNFFSAELVAKRLALLHELVPRAGRVAVLVNPADPERAEAVLADAHVAARSATLEIQVLKASTSSEIDAAF